MALFHLYSVILKNTDSKVFFINLNGEAVSDILDGEVLANGTELTDDLVVGGVLFVLSLVVVERFS